MTNFTSIYDKFLSKIEDYGYAQMTEEDANAHFHKMLQSAISKFNYVCQKDLYQQTKTGFLEPLDEVEQEILAIWMVAIHIENNMVTEENMRNFLNSRDYRQYSSSNLLKVVQDVRDKFTHEALALQSIYDHENLKARWGKKYGK